MQLTVNGRPRRLAPGATLLTLLEDLDIDPETVVIQVNRQVVERGRFGETGLKDGDYVEIARFMAGGGGGRFGRSH